MPQLKLTKRYSLFLPAICCMKRIQRMIPFRFVLHSTRPAPLSLPSALNPRARPTNRARIAAIKRIGNQKEITFPRRQGRSKKKGKQPPSLALNFTSRGYINYPHAYCGTRKINWRSTNSKGRKVS